MRICSVHDYSVDYKNQNNNNYSNNINSTLQHGGKTESQTWSVTAPGRLDIHRGRRVAVTWEMLSKICTDPRPLIAPFGTLSFFHSLSLSPSFSLPVWPLLPSYAKRIITHCAVLYNCFVTFSLGLQGTHPKESYDLVMWMVSLFGWRC